MPVPIQKILQEQHLRQVELETAAMVTTTTSITQAVEQMRQLSARALVVLEQGKPCGMLTQRDLLQRLALRPLDWQQPITTIMSHFQQSLTLEATLQETIELLTAEHRRALPIVNDAGQAIGVITAKALVAYVAAHYPTQIYNLPPHFQQTSPAPEGA